MTDHAPAPATPATDPAAPTAAPPVATGIDWLAWGFVALVLVAMIGVLSVSAKHPRMESAAPTKAAAPRTPAPGAPVLIAPDGTVHVAPPTIDATAPSEVPPDDARAANAAVPFVKGGVQAAAPFRFAGTPDARQRARDCLAAAVLYEAGDDAQGQRAVAQVVLNRLRHPAFPKTVCGVVFEGSDRTTGCQFTFTCDGALARRYSDVAWQRARTLADAALSGAVDGRVGLATHYHTDWVRPYWSDSLDKIAAVDTHLFFRWKGYWGTPPSFRRAASGLEPGIAKLALLSPPHAAATALAGVTPTADPLAGVAGVAAPDAPLAKAVGEPTVVATGEKLEKDTLLVQLDLHAQPDGLPALAEKLCGARKYCKLFGWTNPALLPADGSGLMNDRARIGMSFSYLRDRKAGFERALWNCGEFPRSDPAQCMKR